MQINNANLQLIQELRLRKLLPNFLEVSKVAGFTIVNAYLSRTSEVISDKVFTGMAEGSNDALMKCLSEYVERLAVTEWLRTHVECESHGSDGFAAFPRFMNIAAERARENAFSEALERYVWATWWDNRNIRSEINEIPFLKDLTLTKLHSIIPLQKVFRIRPAISSSSHVLEIYFAKLLDGGFLSGGAAGALGAVDIKSRAYSELLRHGLAASRFRTNAIVPNSFYERRLCLFAFGNPRVVENRLMARGSESVTLPKLSWDEPVHHSLSDLFAVHKCHFDRQPLFLGGMLERLCL